jgi:prepilin signal peptidase PulO-like enzyme (type II secretory pathway)
LTGCIFVLIPNAFLTFQAHPFLKWRFSNLHEAPTGMEMLDPQTAIWWYIAGALFFACTLIAVTVTDFREKLIPHEITYPAMIVGILFSIVVRHDGLGAMAGIGASYILFDFIAFYGLKWYMMMHGEDEQPVRRRRLRRRFRPQARRRLNRSLRWRLDLATIDREQEQNEPMEVMGGGDAVLSAVMSAFLGWQLLVMALMIGFILGTVMGLGLLIREIARANLLHKLLVSCLISSAVGATVLGALGFLMLRVFNNSDDGPDPSTSASFAGLGALGGLLIGIVRVGTHVSKPYPFGPALAAGGMVAIFFLPNWLY